MTRYGLVPACTKKAYRSRKKAAVVARAAVHYLYLRPYRCPACGLFHLTNQRPAERRARLAAAVMEASA